jgi:TonB-dependent receptor
MSLFKLKVHAPSGAHSLLLLCISFFIFLHGQSQPLKNALTGRITDGATGNALFGVSIKNDSAESSASSLADGSYLLRLKDGRYNITFNLEGFQSKTITEVDIRRGGVAYLDIVLFPLSSQLGPKLKNNWLRDSVSVQDSLMTASFYKESRLDIYNPAWFDNGLWDNIPSATVKPGTDKNTKQILKRLNGVVVQDISANTNLQSLIISGIGERYNQVLFNGAILPSFAADVRAYPLELLPAEAIETASLQKISNASIPADFAGGTISIKTKEFPDQNFYYLQVGAGFSDNTRGREFFGDKRGKAEWLGFSGSVRDLPSDFPTTRSQFSLNQKNPQEQVSLSKLLNNNLAPRSYGVSEPNTSVVAGVGKNIQFKKGQRLGILAFVNHQKTELIEESTTQALPDISSSPFPFPDASKALIRASAKDVNYRYTSYLTGVVNATLAFGNNKISLKNYFGSQSVNTLTERSDVFKYDDDSLAHAGINYAAEQRRFLATQLSGEHALGSNNKLKLNWLVSYSYQRRQNPDERNFLLRRDSTDENRFEVARQYGADDITSNGRTWKDLTEHNFTGMADITMPFNLIHQPQVVSGGVYIQNQYRVFFSDLFLTKGVGYFPLNELLAPERYFPGGLSIQNYFVKKDMTTSSPILPVHSGNYNASSNTGAAYIKLENRLTKFLELDWGLRVESNTQLTSNTQYEYFKGYKNPQLLTLNRNIRVINFDFLPSANLSYRPASDIQIHAAYFTTVNRPQLQELSNYRSYEASSFLVRRGNVLLENSTIDNYDAGVRWFPHAGTTVSLSGFYKKMDRPIEYIVSGYSRANLQSTPHNTPPATVKGLNASFKTRLDFIDKARWLSAVSIFGEGNWLRSKVRSGPLKNNETPDVAEHELSGSPEFMVNAGLVVQAPRLPHLTVLYSRTDDYITAVGSGRQVVLANGNMISAIPDYRIKGREQLDIQVSQQFLRSKLQLIAGVNNLLNSPYVQYQDLNGNGKYDEALVLSNRGNQGGFYQSGIDNNLLYIESQPTYYLRISYLFK